MDTFKFGAPGTFEVVVDSPSVQDRGTRLARVAFVIRNLRLGTDDLFDVGDIFERLSATADYNGKREHCGIYAMPAEYAFNSITRVLLGASDEDEFAGIGLLERFRLWFHSTLGDCWLLMVTCGDDARVLLTAFDGAPVQDVRLAADVVESALRNATEQLRLMRPVH